MKKQDGFLYILGHPCRTFSDYGVGDDEHLFKIGVTTRTVNIRLKQHNTDFKKPAGKVVHETGEL
ncbi:GIY-YIG nuclease family protein [Polynucleobacter sp. es-EL-1]|uniref:GIY-YIG nuclease family protein n=1 Tax=Polynucleobacter sp. es-EL-1 TaxID=1855652 RepID=UPI001BFDD6C7|nr:GIY-YIG nuclease family protein [Polynucleobacter sp. es-EL-1]QWE09984.1 GIY-YIG nuclease family protein [Polynucleobacter sp. es-EL-1]